MKDLTLDEKAAELCGYTEKELRSYFNDFVKRLSQANHLTPDQAWETVRSRYNGYWWGAGERVYNPWAILNCMDDCKFLNYWWSSGTPSLLVRLASSLKEPEDMEHITATDLSLQFDLDNIKTEPLLWQTGYLTIKEVVGSLFKLGFPNAEVREAWSAALLDRYRNNTGMDGSTIATVMLEALNSGDRAAFEKTLIALFASIPHHLHIAKEAYYHSVFVATINAAGGQIMPETSTDKGRVDAVLKTRNYVYIIEFKLGSADEAMAQIRQRRYYEPFAAEERKVILLGAGGFAERNIQCLWEDIAPI